MHTLQGDPVYSSQRVCFAFGGVSCFDSQGQPLPAASIVASEQVAARLDAGWQQAALPTLGTCCEGEGLCRSPSPDVGLAQRWVTQEFEMGPHDGLQTFQLNPGVLCVGGHLQVSCTVCTPGPVVVCPGRGIVRMLCGACKLPGTLRTACQSVKA